MNNKVILALIDALVSEAISKIEIPSGPRGPRGLTGRDGNDFSIEDHKESLKSFILENLPKNIELTEDQISSLKGKDGANGRDGKDGRNGRDFIFEEHEERIAEIIKSVSLKFEDLTEDQTNSLKGKDGVNGRDGKDFSFEESQDQINSLLLSYFTAVKESLKLKFSDLTDEERDSLRGPRGQRGKVGKDFVFEENEVGIRKILENLVNDKREELRLKFIDLNSEEKDSLKLKFSDLTDEERDSLRGPRGQRGKIGLPGKDGRDGLDGKDGIDGRDGKTVMGPPGLSGKDGRDGQDGKDGEDAPKIIDVSVDQVGRDLTFNFDFDDGTTLKTNSVEVPKAVVNNYYSPVSYSGGGSNGGEGGGQNGVDGKSAYRIALDNGFIGTELEWLESLKGLDGLNGNDGINGKSAYEIAVESGFSGTLQDWLNSLVGPPGANGRDGVDGTNGANGTNGLNGTDGVDGKSAYEIAVEKGFVGSEAEWLFSLKGLPGENGQDGKSAYEIAVENGFQGTEAEWVEASLGSGTNFNLTVAEEYDKRYSGIREVNFVGEGFKALPRTPIADWLNLSDVFNISEYVGPSGIDKVDVLLDLPDPTTIRNVDCVSDVYVSSFVRVDSQGIAHNALANSYTNSNVIGVVENKNSLFKCDIKIFGKTSKIFSGLDTTLDYFLSDINPGGVSPEPPISSGHIVLRLGQALSSEIFVLSKSERVVRA